MFLLIFMIDDQWIRRRGPKRPVALAVRYGGILGPPLRPAAGRRPTPVRRERKPLSDRPHAGNQPADIRLINRRNEVRRDRSPWPSPGESHKKTPENNAIKNVAVTGCRPTGRRPWDGAGR